MRSWPALPRPHDSLSNPVIHLSVIYPISGHDDIDFHALVPGGRVGVSAKGFSVLLLDMEETEHRHEAINESDGQGATEPINGHYFQINLLGSNPRSKAIVERPLDSHYNYFLGNDSCRWATNALAFASIVYGL